MPANRALSTDEHSSSRSGCDGPAGLALTAWNGCGAGNGSTPAASSSQADSSAKYCGKTSDVAEPSARPVA